MTATQTANGHDTVVSMPSAWDLRIQKATADGFGDPVLISDNLFALLKERALEIITSSRRISEQKQAIKAVAASLGLKLSNKEIDELYEELDSSFTNHEPDVEPGGEFTTQSQTWLLHELFLLGLNLFVGMPGAGKSRFLVALCRAFLNDQGTFLQRQLLQSRGQYILLIGTDQDRQQWGGLLHEQGLADVLNAEWVDGKELVTYRLSPRIYLKTSGGGFRLDAEGMRYIRDWCRQHPGGLVIIDSLSAVLPPGIKEADESAGRLMRQIEIARQGNACIVTHHSTKQAAMSGELGVYSGSGHGSIDRAVSRFIGLGYETRKDGGKERLNEDSPLRILTSQKRGATNQRLILEMGARGSWDYVSTAAEDRELKRQAAEGDPEDRFTGWKLATYKALTTDWKATSQVVDALPADFRNKPSALKQVQRELREMVSEGQIEQDKQSIGEARWRLLPT